MIDKYQFNHNLSNRLKKKRGSVDAVLKPQRKSKNIQYQPKKQISQLSIDLQPHKNMKLSLNKNITHRIQVNQNNNNLCELRQQVQQLRMENQSLREEIKILKNVQSDLKFQLSNVKKQLHSESQKCIKAQINCQKFQQKIQKYSEKIKQLFQYLIEEKKKNAGIDTDVVKVKMALSPSNLSICNSLNLRKFQQEGYRDFYNSTQTNHKEQQYEKQELSKLQNYQRFKKVGWGLENSDSPARYVQKLGLAEKFGTKY